jgi:anaerobic magnesium-protoporphyrin IX monomethyl ester cyclase
MAWTMSTDILFINPNNASSNYQQLAAKYSAIEPPTWALLLAESCRSNGHKVGLLDTLAEQLTDEEAFERIRKIAPKIICFVVYGQNVNAGTTNMAGATRLAAYLKKQGVTELIGFVGSHVQALPKQTLEEELSIDFVFLNEGVLSLKELLNDNAFTIEKLSKISGLAIRTEKNIIITGSPKLVAGDRMDIEMPGYAWDLLPYNKQPLDLYRSPFWHALYKSDVRSPYAAIQTSIGCQFKCSFCMINLINKDDDKVSSIASDYNGMRYWSTKLVINEIKKLIALGVKTIRLTDEMFLLNRKYYRPLIEQLKNLNKNDDLVLWVYSRIDTVPDPETLTDLRKAGIRWLCLGIESGRKDIRLEVSKGKFESVDVEKVVKQVERCGIHVMANYIFGLPGDDEESIEETYQLSVKLNTLGWNTYAAMALPGTALYRDAVLKGIPVPQTYDEFSFHSYRTKPLPTDKLSAARILELRDQKFHDYFQRDEFKQKLLKNFGPEAVENVEQMNLIRLRRKIIEDQEALAS